MNIFYKKLPAIMAVLLFSCFLRASENNIAVDESPIIPALVQKTTSWNYMANMLYYYLTKNNALKEEEVKNILKKAGYLSAANENDIVLDQDPLLPALFEEIQAVENITEKLYYSLTKNNTLKEEEVKNILKKAGYSIDEFLIIRALVEKRIPEEDVANMLYDLVKNNELKEEEVKNILKKAGDSGAAKFLKKWHSFAIDKEQIDQIPLNLSLLFSRYYKNINDRIEALEFFLDSPYGSKYLEKNPHEKMPHRLYKTGYFNPIVAEKITQFFVDKKFDINVKDIDGNTALHVAFLNLLTADDIEKAVSILTRYGADVNIPSSVSQESGYRALTPLMFAAGYSYPISTKLRLIKLLIDAGARVNAQDNYGNTALHYAVANLDARSVRELINLGADKTIKNEAGEKPIDMIPIEYAHLGDRFFIEDFLSE